MNLIPVTRNQTREIDQLRRVSPKQLQREGWTRQAPKVAQFGASYTHVTGWQIQHCGHPTANWPYLLLDPSGEMVLTGILYSGNRRYGVAWPNVAQAAAFVKTQVSREAEVSEEAWTLQA